MTQLDNIKEALSALSIPFKTFDFPHPVSIHHITTHSRIDPADVAVCFGIKCHQEAFIVVHPLDHILSIHRVSLYLGGKVSMLPISTIPSAPNDLLETTCLPPLTSHARASLIVHPSLRNKRRLYFQAGDKQHLIVLEQAGIEKLFAKARFEEMSAAYLSTTEKDVCEIPGIDLQKYTLEELRENIRWKEEFPVMSPIARQVLLLQSDPNADANSLAKVVENSPSLAAQVVKWANSPFYGFPGEIESVEEAILKVLGFDLVMNMVIGITISNKFHIPPDGRIGLNAYWRQSVFTALLVERIAKQLPAHKRPKLGLCYLTGLLHNFGYLVLGELFPQHFKTINDLLPYNPHLSIVSVERAIIGVSHQELGAWLMEEWNLPKPVISVCRHHHAAFSYKLPDYQFIAYIQTAIALLKSLGQGDAESEDIDKAVLKELGLSRSQLETVLDAFALDSERLQYLFGQLVKT